MKKLVYLIGFVGLIASCGAPAEDNTAGDKDTTTASAPVIIQEEEPVVENSFLLETGVVGIFHVGEPMPAMPEELNSRKAIVSLKDETGAMVEHTQYVVFNSLEDIAEVTLENDPGKHDEDLRIQEVRVISNFYETSDGIKIGTPLTTLLEKYPDAEIRYDGLTHDIIAETNSYGNLHFVLDPAACTKSMSGNKDITLQARNFNEDAKIKTIKVY